MKKIIYGIDSLLKDNSIMKDKKIGLIVNSSSVTSYLKYTHVELNNLKKNSVKYLFSPQHGFYQTEQANMIETNNQKDFLTKIPIISLYSKTRKINSRYLKKIDTVIFDLQDVGSRYYTYLWTLYYTMEKCEKLNKELIILDRPNPLTGNFIEGSSLQKKFFSFVGLFDIPNRYGMTIGELGFMFQTKIFPKLKLKIIKMQNWKRNKYFDFYDNYWIPPSPNIPVFETTLVYSGACLLEGTNISEGRGTTSPFFYFGAPYFESSKILKEILKSNLEGFFLKQIQFIPKFDKYKNQICNGFQLIVTDRKKFKPYRFFLNLIYYIKKIYPIKFKWYDKPYEYDYKNYAIDLLTGSSEFRNIVDEQLNIESFIDEMKEYERNFKNKSKEFRLYK